MTEIDSARAVSRADERRLLRLFRTLSAPDRASVLNFAAFLHAQQPAPPPSAPLPLPRPAQETVVAAIKRLRRTYPMLEAADLLHDTAALMTAHVVQGRPAAAVIDELEALFAQHFQHYRQGPR